MGSSPPQQAPKSFEQRLESPMAGSVAAGRPLDGGRDGRQSRRAAAGGAVCQKPGVLADSALGMS